MMETLQRVMMKRKSLKMNQQTKMTSQIHEDEHSDEFHGQQIMEVTLTSILAKHCDLSDLLCILLRMHVFIIIFIALEPHTYVIVHT